MASDAALDDGEFRSVQIGAARLELVVGNIAFEATDAIVNPAQTSLFPGGGADGEIHLWGGRRLMEACRDLNGCETGDAKITTGGDLQARYVIHTVGPIWTGGGSGEADALACCYRRCLEVATENGVRSLAFPAISTGDYGYPMDLAAPVALGAVIGYLRSRPGPNLVRFVLKGRRAFDLHSMALNRLLNTDEDDDDTKGATGAAECSA